MLWKVVFLVAATVAKARAVDERAATESPSQSSEAGSSASNALPGKVRGY
jgi:hypothetical protein